MRHTRPSKEKAVSTLIVVLLLVTVGLVWPPKLAAAEGGKTSAALIERDFMRVVMGAEYGRASAFARNVKKYSDNVRVHIFNKAKKDRSSSIRGFVETLGEKIKGLTITNAASEKDANFRVYVVDRDQYAGVIRKELYQGRPVTVRGICYVRVLPDRKGGISQSDVVIVSDRGEHVFQRCMTEEILQGLGPLADKGDPLFSIFNTRSKHKALTFHDQIIMNALYDTRIKPGMKKADVAKVLPSVIKQWMERLM